MQGLDFQGWLDLLQVVFANILQILKRMKVRSVIIQSLTSVIQVQSIHQENNLPFYRFCIKVLSMSLLLQLEKTTQILIPWSKRL